MKYGEIASQPDYRAACGLYVAETYGVDVVHQLPTVLDTLWSSVLAGATEEVAQRNILSDHRLPVPEKKVSPL